MLSLTDLLYQDSFPEMDDISLSLYKEFSEKYLLKRIFDYTFFDGSTKKIRFTDFGIYHLLGIQHIDRTIGYDNLFARIDGGLSFDDFKTGTSIRRRFKDNKPRLRMFSCIYQTLRLGKYFYCPNGKVINTQDVEMDYIIYRRISDKGNNIGIKLLKEGYYSPLTLLVARAINPTEYIDVNKLLKVSSLVISEENSGQIIETMYYTDEFIMSEQEG